jgi:dihydroneopterin aldolase
MDKVFVEGLEIETIIGIYDWEREVKQIVRIDLEMAWDNKPAAKSEDIQFALNYKDVSKRLIGYIGGSEFLLVETMAEAIAQIILIEFKVPWLDLKLSKPGAIRGAIAVGVHIQRTQEDMESLETYVPQPSVIEDA